MNPTLAESLAFSGTRTLRKNKVGLGSTPMPRRGVVN
jgi:hypothetical protein